MISRRTVFLGATGALVDESSSLCGQIALTNNSAAILA